MNEAASPNDQRRETMPAINYADLSAGDLLEALGDDAAKWAAAFVQTAEKLGHKGIDEGWMIGWFANAIEHSGDVRAGRRFGNPLS